MKLITTVLASLICAALSLHGEEANQGDSLHDFTAKNITGEEVALSDFAGKIVLIVNVAAECGVTDQYEVLQALYDVLKDRDFVVLGFPTNEFGGQEPGTNAEIAAFCKKEYSVTFPMFAKVSVKGKDIDPLFKFLTDDKKFGGEVKWNFNKFYSTRS